MHTKESRLTILIAGIFALFLFPSVAQANVISIFHQNIILHLFIGNAFLGLIEGILIARIFKISIMRAVLFMIAGNYFSSWIGAGSLLLFGSQLHYPLLHLVTIDNLHYFLLCLIIFAYLATVILEWPFCLFIMWAKPKRVKKSLYASIIAQTLSYLLILIFNPPFGHFYGNPVGHRKIDIVPVKTFADVPNATIYFISISDGNLYTVKPDGSSLEKVCTLPVKQMNMKLLAKPADKPNLWKLYMEKQPDHYWEKPTDELIYTGIEVSGYTQIELDRDPKNRDRTRKRAIDLRTKDPNSLQIYTAMLGDTWLGVENPLELYSPEIIHLQFDRHILYWTTCNATVLPGDQVVYQLGSQIVLLDPKESKLGLITLGLGPVVFLAK